MEESVTVTVLEGGGSCSVKEIFLLGHCVLCLRRTSKRRREDNVESPRQTKRAKTDAVPEAEFLANCGSPGLLWTLNWTWNVLRKKWRNAGFGVNDKEDVFGASGGGWTTSELKNVVIFNSTPTMCQDCGDKLLEVDKLLNQVTEEISCLRNSLGILNAFGNFRKELFDSAMEKRSVQETLGFLKEFENRIVGSGGNLEDSNLLHILNPESKEARTGSGNTWVDEGGSPGNETCTVFTDEDSIKIEDDDGLSLTWSPEAPPDEQAVVLPTEPIKVETDMPQSSTSARPLLSKNFIGPDDGNEDDTEHSSVEGSETEDDEDDDYTPDSKRSGLGKEKKCQQKRSSSRVAAGHLQKEKLEQQLSNVVSNDLSKLKCDICGHVGTQTALRKHKQRRHGVDPPKQVLTAERINCEHCALQVSKRCYRYHLKKHHPKLFISNDRKKTCDFCKMELFRSELVEHLKEHVPEEYVLRCPNPGCTFGCITLQALLTHLWHSKAFDGSCKDYLTKNQPGFVQSLRNCTECNYEFDNLHKLRSHLSRHHETPEKNYPCPISGCQQRFSVRQSVVLHLNKHDVPRQVTTQPCVSCGKKLVKVEEMEAHLKEEHSVLEVVKCRKCPFRFPSWDELVNHMFEHRNGELLCDICGDAGGKFNRHVYLQEHYFKVHQIGKQYQCEQCPKTFFKLPSLQSHVDIEHGTKVKPIQPRLLYQCKDCDAVYKSEDGLRGHKIREHGAEPFCCTMCSETFSNRPALVEHEKAEHRGIAKPTEYPCLEAGCGKVFRNQGQLSYHRSAAHSTRKFVCEQCGKEYRTAGDLKRHNEVNHLGIRNWICDTCGEAFTERCTLKRHNLIHTGERPFACDICGQRFRHKEVLKTHVEGHVKKGADFKPNGPMKQIRKRVKRP